jgi:hypothetical protein
MGGASTTVSVCSGKYKTLAEAFVARKSAESIGQECHVESAVVFQWSIPLFTTQYVLVDGSGPLCPAMSYGMTHPEDAYTCAKGIQSASGKLCSVSVVRGLGSVMTDFISPWHYDVKCE